MSETLNSAAGILAMTLFFCVVSAAIDGIENRQLAFDQDHWWYPI